MTGMDLYSKTNRKTTAQNLAVWSGVGTPGATAFGNFFNCGSCHLFSAPYSTHVFTARTPAPFTTISAV